MTDPARSSNSEMEVPRAPTATTTAARHDEDEDEAAAITVGAATAVDAPALIDLHTAAFGADLFSHLMLLGRPPGTHEGFMRRALDAWFADPDAHVVRAVDADGAVVGWACWVRKTPPGAAERREEGEEAEGPKQADEEPAPPAGEARGDTAAARPSSPSPPPPASGTAAARDDAEGGESGPGALGRRMRADLVRWEAAHVGGGGGGGGAYLVLQALATDPARQNRGVGTRLVRWGVARAEAQGLACWAHASPAGHGLYARAGFAELGRSDYDLAAWAPGGRAGGRGWGVYTFRYMLRRPRGGTAAP